MSFLVICKMFGLFVNTFTAHVKYCLLNRDNLMQTIQIDLPKNQKSFSEFFSAFLKSRLNFYHLEIKDDPQRVCISEYKDCKGRGERNV